jgi:misacylated tRNA(Ala) deacylase
MTKLLYLTDCYLKEFDAKVISSQKNLVELDQTAFYPLGGGQPNDKGKIIADNQEFQVVNVFKQEGKVFHQLDKDGIKEGTLVHCIIDWERRYKLMRMHTAAHVISEVINRETNALITGNQLDVEKSRIDFNLESFDRRKIEECIEKANEIIRKDLPVKIYFLKREEAMKIPKITKLANVLPPTLPELRIVEIVGFDLQADGGTHVKSLSEIGEIVLEDMVNKGKNNRRIYYSLKP